MAAYKVNLETHLYLLQEFTLNFFIKFFMVWFPFLGIITNKLLANIFCSRTKKENHLMALNFYYFWNFCEFEFKTLKFNFNILNIWFELNVYIHKFIIHDTFQESLRLSRKETNIFAASVSLRLEKVNFLLSWETHKSLSSF